MNHRQIVRAAYIQNSPILCMTTNQNNDSTYDYSGLFIDDEEF